MQTPTFHNYDPLTPTSQTPTSHIPTSLIQKLRAGELKSLELQPQEQERDSDGFASRLMGSVRLIRSSSTLSGLTILLAAMMITFGAEGVLTVLIAERQLGLGGSGAGYLVAAAGLGAIGAPWVVPRILKSASLAFGVTAATLMQAFPLFVLALTNVPPLAIGVMVFEGVVAALFETATASTVQRTAPPESIGRIFGLFGSLAAATELIGAAIVPVILLTLNLRTVTLVFAATVLALGVAAGTLLNRNPRPADGRLKNDQKQQAAATIN